MNNFKQIVSISLLLVCKILFSSEDSELQKNETSGIKFRGSFYLGFNYYFPNNPVNISDNISFIDYNYSYDYTDNGDPDNKNHSKNDQGKKFKANAFRIEPQMGGNYSFILPCLVNDHFLFSNNNLKFTAGINLSPVSFNSSYNISFTPIAFLVLSSGFSLGTGWNIPSLGAYGMARINKKTFKVIEGDDFFGPILKNWFTVTIQMDTAAIVQKSYKKWSHVLFLVNTSFNHIVLLNYPYYDHPYYWELGYTRNGWSFSANFMLGYSLPLIEDEKLRKAEEKRFKGFVQNNNFAIRILMSSAISTNLTYFNESRIDAGGYGSDFLYTNFGPVLYFELPNNVFAALNLSWTTSRLYTLKTIGNVNRQNQVYEDWYLSFNKIGMVVGMNF